MQIDEQHDYRLITCIVAAGRAREILNRLRESWEVIDVIFHHARSVDGHQKRRGRLFFEERDIAQVLIRPEDSDAVFEFLYRTAGIGEPHAGMIFMTRAGRSHPMVPPAGFVEY